MPRYLLPPSTAATLNVAATAAQCARIWEKLDKAFSAKCLAAAEKAWAAAQANPAVYAGTSAVGGGPYDDTHVERRVLLGGRRAVHHDQEGRLQGGAREVALLQEGPASVGGRRASPARSTGGTSPRWGRSRWRWSRTGCRRRTSTTARSPSRRPPTRSRRWSTSRGIACRSSRARRGTRGARTRPCLNNALILALAHDFAGDAKYLNAAAEAVNYVLGRNPMDKSYVTGYGERPLMNPHHRFWAHQANPAFPSPPPGVLSGGPNSGLQDPYVQAAGLPAARLRSATPTTSRRGRRTRWRSTGTRRSRGSPRSWTRRPAPAPRRTAASRTRTSRRPRRSSDRGPSRSPSYSYPR